MAKETGVDHNKTVAHELSKVLADTFTIYQKTHGYHWNVRGPNFRGLHLLLEEQYNEIWTSVDEIAERIRALGEVAPMGSDAFGNLTSIKDGDPSLSADAMLKDLVAGNEATVATLKKAAEMADEAGDISTNDLCTQRITAHEKHLWMLKASLA
ncbi:DNA starvation/stationary phase protection protein [Asticcacaulis sp. EMRT-3]|uniref:Dps family protein n=1 Tax=Asticcacaulis sp. EMRT-3 TaxID=3040349 RepID=UPI0024AF45D0|nr:DNA starvation/stationary phase protection protein [Asticcacaulis sp. EMRT-3]MDI7775217.1 DNA starvation/stationary phase protection protein [Asticcacaulis sp. EMRT-3]